MLVLVMLLVMVMASYMLDRYSCMMVSQSGFALVFGLLVGLMSIVGGKHVALHNHLNLDNTIFFDVLLPPIIYQGGFSIKRQAFFRNFPAIISTAVLGTVIATCVTGSVLFYAGRYEIVTRLSWVESFLFGALISSIDPVGTLACFNKLNVPPLLFNLVFGESVLNDAIAIALYQTLLKWSPEKDLTTKELMLVALNSGGMFIGSLLVSAVITLFGAFLMKRKVFSTLRYFPTYEISLCLIFSLLTYFVADSLHLSGIVALFFSGTMTAHYHFHTISREAQHSFTHLLHTLAFVCETIVYVFMGTSVIMLFAGHVEKSKGTALRVDDMDWSFVGLTMFTCFVARFLNIFPLLSLSNCFRSGSDRISVKYMSVIWFAGLRGSISFALAKNWSYIGPNGESHRKLMESTTLMVVLFTTLVIGAFTGPLLTSLKLTNVKRPYEPEVESDTASSSGESLRLDSPGANAVSRTLPRRTMHFVVNTGAPREQHVVDTSRSFAELPTNDNDGEPSVVYTPRPQFRDSLGDEDELCDDQPHSTVAAAPQLSSMLRKESYMGSFLRNWQAFDASYMQPIFGGTSQAPTAAAADAATRGQQHQLSKCDSESAI